MQSLRNLKSVAAVGFVGVSLLCIVESADAQNTDQYLTDYINAVNERMPPKGDPASVAELFSQDAVQHHPNGPPGTQNGQAELRKFFGGFSNLFSDWTHVEKNRLIQGNHAVWEGTAEGHHKETGKFLRLPIVFFLDFDDQGEVKEDRVYVDNHLVADQLK